MSFALKLYVLKLFVSAESKIEGFKVDAVFLITFLSACVTCPAILIVFDCVNLLIGEVTNFEVLSV